MESHNNNRENFYSGGVTSFQGVEVLVLSIHKLIYPDILNTEVSSLQGDWNRGVPLYTEGFHCIESWNSLVYSTNLCGFVWAKMLISTYIRMALITYIIKVGFLILAIIRDILANFRGLLRLLELYYKLAWIYPFTWFMTGIRDSCPEKEKVMTYRSLHFRKGWPDSLYFIS